MSKPTLKIIDGKSGVTLGSDNAPLLTNDAVDSILPLALINVGLEIGGQTLLDQINLSFVAGQSSFILGPNGAGKTMLLRVCHGLVKPTRGEVRWRLPGVAKMPAAQGMVFQRPITLRRNVVKNIEYAMQVCGVAAELREGRLAAALSVAGLERLAYRQARHLSGGEQQRLALARCLAVQPQVLFLDEPTSHLDPSATRKVEEVVTAIREQGTRIIMVSHDLGQAKRLADHIVFMHGGRVVESGAASDFFSRPSTKQGAAFLAGELLW